MPSFSERYGYKEACNIMQLEKMNDDLRMSIYNAIRKFFGEFDSESFSAAALYHLWTNFWHRAIDRFPDGYWRFYPNLEEYIMKSEWYEPYDLIEFLADELKAIDDEYNTLRPQQAFYSSVYSPMSYYDPNNVLTELEDYSKGINSALVREMSGYRLVGTSVVPITSEVELVSIEEALVVDDVFSGVRLHIGSALEHFSKKPEPDYRNTIKEAISAVEAAVDAVTATESNKLGDKINELRDSHGLHSALAEGWKKLYGFTSDEGGIRHWASSDEVNVDFALAKYMLVSCLAFVNYLIESNFKEGDR